MIIKTFIIASLLSTPLLAATPAQWDEAIQEFSSVMIPLVEGMGEIRLEPPIIDLKDTTRRNATPMPLPRKSTELRHYQIQVTSGMARMKELTRDGLIAVFCHELGHVIGGWPQRKDLMSIEGQADYFASVGCMRTIWVNQKEKNKKLKGRVDPVAKRKCNSAWTHEDDRNLCYRISSSALSFIDTITRAEAMSGFSNPDYSFSSHSTKKPISTDEGHPDVQCRLDTFLNGSLCQQNYQFHKTPTTREMSAENFCQGEQKGSRPRCWFSPTMN